MKDETTNLLSNCRIILVNTTHPGNVGATARAMKTMGLSELYLVSEDSGIIDDHAFARASGADDVLGKCVVVQTLQQAVAGCNYLIGTSARSRTLSSQVLTPRDAATFAINDHVAMGNKIAIVFGQERMGLTNTELSLCHVQIIIPANPEYSSLNLSSAVQLICYELRLAVLKNIDNNELTNNLAANNLKRDRVELVDAADMELFYEHLERVMLKTHFLDPKQPKLLMQRLRRLYNRAQVGKQELNILRGILTACEKKSDLADSLSCANNCDDTTRN